MSESLELIVRGGEVATPTGCAVADLGIARGRIVSAAPSLRESAAREIDARGLVVFPGILDAHVHFNEPGREEWEGLASGSASLAAGGGTWFADMPLNSTPPVVDAAAVRAKREIAARRSCVDFSVWGGLVPGNLEQLAPMAREGVMGFKAFMCHSGLDEFAGVDAATLRAGMQRAAQLGLPVAVHAEDDAMARELTTAARARGAKDVRSWLATRPVAVELAAIRLALDLAGETGAALHIVHVSSPEGIALVSEAKRRGVNVTAETCPHYLLLNEGATITQGAPAKCAPPLRSEAARRRLWQALRGGGVDTIGSDHSPAPPAMKSSSDFFEIWGGISGVQHGFPLLISEAVRTLQREVALPLLARTLAANVARRFQLAHKGALAPGHDADFALLDLDAKHALSNDDLRYRHRQGPYNGRSCDVAVRGTFLRGQQVDDRGVAPGAPAAQFIRPTPSPHA